MRSRQDDFFFFFYYFAFHTRYFAKCLLSIYFYDVGGALNWTRVRPIFRRIKNSHGGKIIVQYITHRVYRPFKCRYTSYYTLILYRVSRTLRRFYFFETPLFTIIYIILLFFYTHYIIVYYRDADKQSAACRNSDRTY